MLCRRRSGGGTAGGYAGLVVAAVLAGLGNAPFHPVDFTILNKRVSPQRLGHGFSVHGISGNLGWATAPVFMAGIARPAAPGRVACLAGAALALLVLAIMVWNRDALDDRQGSWAHQTAKGAAAVPEHPMAFLKLPAVWLCFSFVLLLEHLLAQRHPELCRPVAAEHVWHSLSLTTMVVTGYMLCGAGAW